MTSIPKKKSLSPPENDCLRPIYEITKINTKFYMNSLGELFWSFENSTPKALEEMPIKVQIPFFLKFIQNHALAERLKFIKDPLTCIELYVKAKFVFNTDLEINQFNIEMI